LGRNVIRRVESSRRPGRGTPRNRADILALDAGISERLRFTGPLLADLFMGKVHRWNDPVIAKLNPTSPFRTPR